VVPAGSAVVLVDSKAWAVRPAGSAALLVVPADSRAWAVPVVPVEEENNNSPSGRLAPFKTTTSGLFSPLFCFLLPSAEMSRFILKKH
jgi:hypothetical protein